MLFRIGADQKKHQNSASLAYVRGIHQWPAKSPHIWPLTRKMFPFDHGSPCSSDSRNELWLAFPEIAQTARGADDDNGNESATASQL